MNQNEKSLATGFSVRWLIDLIIITSLMSVLSIPTLLAREAQTSVTVNDQAQPATPAMATPEPEKAMTRTLANNSPASSVDFLMEEPPLTQSTLMDATSPITVPEPLPVSNAVPSPVTLEVLQGTVLEKTDEVAMLVSEQCSQNGSAAEGMNSCARVYSNGHRATVLTQNAAEGDELKHQTVIEEFDADNILLYRKTIRHRVDYNYLDGQKAKEKELFDIIYQPAGKKTTRELMVYEYFLDTGKTKALSWTQYKQIADEPRAELVYHAVLRYGDDGSPDRGLAEMWDHGKRADTFMNWSRRSKGFATLDPEAWGQWESWIQNVSLQAYLP